MLISDLKKQINNDSIADTIIAVVLNRRKSDVQFITEIEDRFVAKCLKVAHRYGQGRPIASLIKKRYFYNIPFYINKHVLIPRLESEIVAKTAIEAINEIHCANGLPEVLDLCTGSGCFAVTIAKHTRAILTACDISPEALSVARRNARQNNVKVEFRCGDMFAAVGGKKFDIIVSNPPYVEDSKIELHQKTLFKEPKISLYGGGDGLDFFRIIARDASAYLKVDGMLILETYADYGFKVIALLRENGFRDIQLLHHSSSYNKVIVCKRA